MYSAFRKEYDLFRSAWVPFAIGIGLKWDGTKMKLSKANNTAQTTEIIVRSLCVISSDGGKQLAAPILARLFLD